MGSPRLHPLALGDENRIQRRVAVPAKADIGRAISPCLWLWLQPRDADEGGEVFEDSDLLRHDVLVLRATAPPDALFSVFDETGREIGRVIAEGGLVRKKPARLVLYDRQHTHVLVVEHVEEHGETTMRFTDGQGQPIDIGLVRLKPQGSLFRRRASPCWTFRDARKEEVGSYAIALPPEGDHRLGVTILFRITAAVSSELRLATLGVAIFTADSVSRQPAWILKRPPKAPLAWPGSANGHLPPTADNG